jgi:Ca2+-binding RTX toxin-like protein
MRASNRLGRRRLGGRKAAKSHAKRGLQACSFETLENRTLLAGNTLTVVPTAGTVTITGTTKDDVIQVDLTSNDRLQVRWNGKVVSSTIALSSFTNLNILGDAGNDKIVVNNIPKTIDVKGGIGTDSLAIVGKVGANNFVLDTGSLAAPGRVHTFAEIENLRVDGGKNNDLLTITNLPEIATQFNGMGGIDEIVGPNTSNLWKITQFNVGTLDTTFAFSGVENITGGTANDRFRFFNGKSISGNIDGGDGTDILDYENYSTKVKVNATTHFATGTGGIDNIEGFIDPGATTLALIGVSNGPNVWHITGTNSGTVNGFAFSDMPNLKGGSGIDMFVFSTGGTITGTIDGSAGADVIDHSARNDSTTIQLSKIVSIAQIIGASNATVDTKLVGANSSTAWNITGTNAGNVSGIAFSNITSFTGGSGSDTFIFTNDAKIKNDAGKIDGGGGTDTINFSSDTLARTVDLKIITNFETIFGGANAGDTLVGADAANTWNITSNNGGTVGTTAFSSFENLTGGPLDDKFVFGKGVGVSGKIDGGLGRNTLDYSAYDTSVTVDLSLGTATNIAGGLVLGHIQDIAGGTKDDTLTGDAQNNYIDGKAGNDIINGSDGNDTLFGDDGDDQLFGGGDRDLLFGNLGADTLNGGAGEDILFDGTNNFDLSVPTTDALLSVWTNSDPYAARVDKLRNGTSGVAAAPLLNASTVTPDTSVDTLTGGIGNLDWYFLSTSGSAIDIITDLEGGELQN